MGVRLGMRTIIKASPENNAPPLSVNRTARALGRGRIAADNNTCKATYTTVAAMISTFSALLKRASVAEQSADSAVDEM